MDFANQTYHLKAYSLLGIRGEKAAEFLQGVITNDIKIITDNSCIYAAHLTPQGKLVADFLIFCLAEDLYGLCLPANHLITLAKAMHPYAIGTQVEFEDLSDTYAVSLGKAPSEAIVSTKDPRLPELPSWHIVPIALAKSCPEGDELWLNARLTYGIPSAPQDLHGKPLPAEWGLEYLNGTSFNKGCYVGQEVTTRMHHRTTPKKRLYMVEIEPSHALSTGDAILNESKAEVGWLLSHQDTRGLALLRDRVLEKSNDLSGVKNCNLQKQRWWA